MRVKAANFDALTPLKTLRPSKPEIQRLITLIHTCSGYYTLLAKTAPVLSS